MKTVILCGGRGIRLNELTGLIPKPMVTIKNKPILHHLMSVYSRFGHDEFVLCLGYRGDAIKDYFVRFVQHNSDLSVDLSGNRVKTNSAAIPPWKVHLIDTGPDTDTGGRIFRIRKYVDGSFLMTYGDGLANIDVKQLLRFHKRTGRIATMTAVHPVARFGLVTIEGDLARYFYEKPQLDNSWINGGFFVLDKRIFDYLDESCNFERDALQRLAREGQLACFRHHGYWRCMDTYRDYLALCEDATGKDVPWLQFGKNV